MIVIKILGLWVGDKKRPLYQEEVKDLAARVRSFVKQSHLEAKVSVEGKRITVSKLNNPNGTKKNPLNKREREAFMKKLSSNFAYYLCNVVVAFKEV